MTDQSEPNPIQQAFASSASAPASVQKISAWLLSSFHSARDGMVVADAAGHIVLLNRETERMFGYPARRLIGKPLDVLFSILSQADYSPQARACLAQDEHAGESRVSLALQGVRADGEEFPLEASMSSLRAEGERFLALVLRANPADSASRPAPIPAHALLHRLSASTHQANEVERRRFSRELYDDLGQNLGVLKLDLDWLQTSCTDTGAPFQARVAHMQTVLDNIIVRTKSIASALRPPLLDDFGLVAALKWASQRFQKKTGIRCSLQSGEFANAISEPHGSVIFRVVQEGLLNVERHAGASHVHLALWHADGDLHVLLRDNGRGMAPDSRGKPGCFGLMAMQQRIYSLGGKITIANVRPSGVEIHAMIPFEPGGGETT